MLLCQTSNEVARVIYQDEMVKLERSSDFVGHTGEKIDYSTKDTIAKYLKQGYKPRERIR